MNRLSEKQRAMLAGGEAPLWLRLQARFRATEADQADIAALRAIREAMPNARELPEYFAWDALAGEMKGNILLAVEAGDAVRPRMLPGPIGWRAGLVMATLSLLVVAGYWWKMPRPLPVVPPPGQVVLEAAPGEMGIEQSGAGFTLMVDDHSARPLVNGALGGMRTDYVDPQTGQLTVAHVYAE